MPIAAEAWNAGLAPEVACPRRSADGRTTIRLQGGREADISDVSVENAVSSPCSSLTHGKKIAMGLRFSIRWLLAAMLYTAIAAAALTQDHWAYADVLWLATFLAFAYAVLLACYLRGERQARAVGFAVVAACVVLCLVFVPDALPTQRILAACGVGQDQLVFAPPPTMATGTFVASQPVPMSYGVASTGSSGSWTLQQRYASSIAVASQPSTSAALKLRAANALTAMLAGLVGCVLGVAAFRRAASSR